MSAVEITWAGGEHRFLLNIAGLRALQQRCDAGPEWILRRLRSGAWLVDDVVQTIRLGLEGAGMDKAEAKRLVVLHVEERPITLSVLAAQLILGAALYGVEDDPVGEVRGEEDPIPGPTSPAENGDSAASTEPESLSA